MKNQVQLITYVDRISGGGLAKTITLSGNAYVSAIGSLAIGNIKHAIDGIHVPPIPDSWWYHGPRLLMQPALAWWALFCAEVIAWPWRETSDR